MFREFALIILKTCRIPEPMTLFPPSKETGVIQKLVWISDQPFFKTSNPLHDNISLTAISGLCNQYSMLCCTHDQPEQIIHCISIQQIHTYISCSWRWNCTCIVWGFGFSATPRAADWRSQDTKPCNKTCIYYYRDTITCDIQMRWLY